MFYCGNIQAYPTPILYLKRGKGEELLVDTIAMAASILDVTYFLVVVYGDSNEEATTMAASITEVDYFLAIVDSATFEDDVTLAASIFLSEL